MKRWLKGISPIASSQLSFSISIPISISISEGEDADGDRKFLWSNASCRVISLATDMIIRVAGRIFLWLLKNARLYPFPAYELIRWEILEIFERKGRQARRVSNESRPIDLDSCLEKQMRKTDRSLSEIRLGNAIILLMACLSCLAHITAAPASLQLHY